MPSSEFEFGEFGPTPRNIPKGDVAFMASLKDFARGEIHMPSGVVASTMVAYRHVRERRFAEAVKVYDEILKDSPDRAEAWVNRGVALQALGRLDEALASFDRSL